MSVLAWAAMSLHACVCVMQALQDLKLSPVQIQNIIKEVDKDGNGEIGELL